MRPVYFMEFIEITRYIGMIDQDAGLPNIQTSTTSDRKKSVC